MIKKLSPLRLTFLIAICAGCTALITFMVSQYLFGFNIPFYILIICCISVSFLVYGITRLLMKYFIYQRLLPIYNVINTRKFERKVSLDNKEFDQDPLGMLEGEFSNWAEAKKSEIQVLKNLEQYRKDYLGNISHELKTPLTSVNGYIHTLLEGVEDPDIQKKFLRRAAANTDRIMDIVNDLELIMKLESEELEMEMEPFDIQKLVNGIFQDLHFQAEEMKINFALKTNGLNQFMVVGNEKSIGQVINNLLINSIKYGRKGGLSTVHLLDMGKYIQIEVSDDGRGIEEKHLPFLFDRFYRTDDSRNRNIGGSGLGLSIVKHILQKHDKTIYVRSTLEEGSSFSFALDKA